MRDQMNMYGNSYIHQRSAQIVRNEMYVTQPIIDVSAQLDGEECPLLS